MSVHPNLFSKLDAKELCLSLLHAESEEDVVSILDAEGHSLENMNDWVPLGGNLGNFSTVGNQQEEGTAAFVEKIINSIDAVLMAECYGSGIDPESKDEAPQSMNEAVERFLGVKQGRLDYLATSEQRELSENIHIIATGSKTSPSYSVVDKGEGQSPNSFITTFLSTTGQASPKIKIPFVQGKFNAGGTGSLQFCGKQNIQLVISRRHPSCPVDDNDDLADCWGFTVIRRKRPKTGEKHSVFQYLAPNGNILNFKSDCLNLLPGKSSKQKPCKPYSEPLKYGTCIKLYNYRWPAKSTATLEARRELEKFIQGPCLPFRIHETRNYKANYYANTVIGIWNEIRSENNMSEEKGKSKLEPGFPAPAAITVEGVGTLPIKIVVWNADVDPSNVVTGVYFLVNGQVHGFYQRDFISRRLGFDYIKDHLLIAIDCTLMDPSVAEDLFMASRDRLRKNEEYDEIRKLLGQELKEHPGLKETNARWRQKQREKAAESNEDLTDVFNELLKDNPSLSVLFGLGGQLHGGVGPGKPHKFDGRKFPTYFRIAKEPKGGLVNHCPINRAVAVEFETDAENFYFERPDEPGELTVDPSINLIHARRLWNGRFSVKFIVPWNAKVGDEIELNLSVGDVTTISKGPYECKFKIIVEKAANDKKKKSGDKNPPVNLQSDNPKLNIPKFKIPKPVPVKKDNWKANGFSSANQGLRIKKGAEGAEGEDGYDFYYNADNCYLINEVSAKKENMELVHQWFSWGLTLAALGTIYHEDNNHSGNAGETKADLDEIGRMCDGLSVVIIPIIKSLHNFPLNNHS